MKKWILLSSALMTCAALCAANAAKMNQDVGFGLDCEIFLNPLIEEEFKSVSGQAVLDAGCGLAPRAIMAAKSGASVCAIDPKKNLLEQAFTAVQKAGVESQVTFYQGSMEQLPYPSNTFDLALCVNSTTDMTATMHVVTQDEFQEKGLGAHFFEIARVMKEGGRLIVAAPASYGVVFTNGSVPSDAAYEHINQVLAKIGTSSDSFLITKHLSELEEVTRATFVSTNEGLKLITNEKELCIGQPIWCKIPDGVISSIYHSEEEYLVAINRASLTCEEIKRPCFFGKVKYDMWCRSPHVCGRSLGEAYIDNHPFTLYYVMKKA